MSGVGYAKWYSVQASEWAQIDSQLSAFAADRFGGCIVTGTWLLAQDPANPGIHPSITSGFAVSGVDPTTGAPSVIGTGPAGTFLLNNKPAQYSAPRTRIVRFSPLEAMRLTTAISGGVIQRATPAVVDPATGGLAQAIKSLAADPVPFALAKPMDGATITSLRFYFYVPSVPASTTGSLLFGLYRIDVTTGAAGYVGYNQVNIPSPATWYANGQAQSLALTTSAGTGPLGSTGFGLLGAGSNILNLSAYTYLLQWQGPATGSAPYLPAPIVTGIEITYSYSDERFTQ